MEEEEIDKKLNAIKKYEEEKIKEEKKGEEKEILTFGPISVHPNFQRNGGGVISNCYASQGVKTRKSGRKKMVLP